MESTPKKAPRSKFPALLVVALALVALVFVIWRVDSAPSTNDAYASADTIDVVPEVSGRIVELAVTDNQAVKQGDLLFRIDPRPYEANLAKAEASLAALDKHIMLTQRSVDAQQFGADSVNATVEKARAAAKQASDTLRRTEPLLREGFVSAEEVDRARTAQRAAEADLNAVLLQAQSAASAVSGVDGSLTCGTEPEPAALIRGRVVRDQGVFHIQSAVITCIALTVNAASEIPGRVSSDNAGLETDPIRI